MEPVGATRILLLILQIHAAMCVKARVVSGKEGHGLDFTCEYPEKVQNNTKFFCRAEHGCGSFLIQTHGGDRWVTKGRLSLYDNTTAGLFMVRVDRLDRSDSGTYWCGVDIIDDPDFIRTIQLNVTTTDHGLTAHPAIIVDKRNLPMFLTAVSCLAALLFVFLFTLCLVFTIRNRRHAPQTIRATEMSSDYATMKSGVLPEPNPCSCTDCDTFSNNTQKEPRVFHLSNTHRSKQCESVVMEDYTNVDMPQRISQYQNLDMSSMEEHVYYGIDCKPKSTFSD